VYIDNLADAEPDPTDLAAIEADWPLIAAEIAVVEAECRLAAAPADVLAIRAHRRAVRAALAAAAQHAKHLEPTDTAAPVIEFPTTRKASGTIPDAA
jgi:hypothetical protein